ncbi:hypothetical protein MRX96_023102 [Rhipicephalus microplus]
MLYLNVNVKRNVHYVRIHRPREYNAGIRTLKYSGILPEIGADPLFVSTARSFRRAYWSCSFTTRGYRGVRVCDDTKRHAQPTRCDAQKQRCVCLGEFAR